MKKSLFIIGILPLLLAGCTSEKTLSCKIESDTTTFEVNSKYKNDKVEKVDVKIDFSADAIPAEELELLGDNGLCENIKELIGYSIDNCKQTATQEKITITGTMPKTEDQPEKIDDFQNTMEQNGYTCSKK